MKILHVIDDMSMGGAQSLLVEMAPIQQELGNEVMILELKKSKDKTLVNKLKTTGIRVEALSTKRPVRSLKNIFSLVSYLRCNDIVHVHLFPANYWVALAKIISFSRTPIITTEHSTDNKRRKIAVFKYIDTFIYNRYKEVIACADKAMETFKNRYKGIKCITISNGVDIRKYTHAKPYSKKELVGIGEDTFVITMVARFCYPKRQDTLIHAIASLPPKYHAVFVGGQVGEKGILKAKLLAKELDVTERVHFLYLRSDVPRILKSSDVILMSSEYEGLSLSSIEGMASGRPFIASNVDGLREAVGGAGILIEYANVKELVDVLLKLDTDKDYYQDIASSCLKRAKEYDIHTVVEKYQNVYVKYVR